MRTRSTGILVWTFIATLFATAGVSAQESYSTRPLTGPQDHISAGPFTGEAIVNAPFTAVGVTTQTQVHADGTRTSRQHLARYYRDSAGRVRAEELVAAVGSLRSARLGLVIVDSDLSDNRVTVIDSNTSTFGITHRVIAEVIFSGGSAVRSGRNGFYFLSSKALTGTETLVSEHQEFDVFPDSGDRATARPTGNGNAIMDERWKSAQLGVVVYARKSDPSFGDVEYRLTDIQRTEPPSELFDVPAHYTMERNRSPSLVSADLIPSR